MATVSVEGSCAIGILETAAFSALHAGTDIFCVLHHTEVECFHFFGVVRVKMQDIRFVFGQFMVVFQHRFLEGEV